MARLRDETAATEATLRELQAVQRDSGIKDNPNIVWDEQIGFSLVLFAVAFCLSWI